MTATADRADEEPTRHANFFVPRAAGIGSLGWLGSFIAGGGVLAAMLAVTFAGLLAMLVVLAVTGGLLTLLLFRDKHGRNLAQRIGDRIVFRRAVRAGTNLLRAGPLSPLPYGETRLPGLGAALELTEYGDTRRGQFLLVHCPATATAATAWVCDPPGSQSLDQRDINTMVSNLGGWLDGHTQEDRLIAASITVETRPDSGNRLRAAVESRRAVAAPAVAVAAMNATLDRLSVGGASIRGYATATFALDPGGERQLTVPELATELASRVPLIGDALRSTGAGVVHPMSGQELCEVLRGAYEQQAAALIEAAYADGAPIPLSFTQVGPIAHEARWREYRHDDGWSVSWVMSRPPRGVITPAVLTRLLAPHPVIPVKRVTLHYRPWDLGEAAERVEGDVHDAEWAVDNPTRGRPSAQARKHLERTERTAAEEAEGAGLHNFTIVVTATVTSYAQLRDARAVMGSLTKGSRLLMREPYGGQDTAFLFGLPLGLVPALHNATPEMLSERL